MISGKRLLRSEPVQSALAWLVALYIRLVHMTTQWTVVRPPSTERLLSSGRPFIACFWHGRMLLMRAALAPESAIHILISEHRDGVMIARALAALGIRTVAGSSKRGGVTALRNMQRLLAEGKNVAITPDGPRGPRMRAKMGAIKAAQLAGVALLPISGAAKRRRVLGSWDRFCLAFPFGRGVIVWGEPIEVPRAAGDADIERLRLMLEDRLNEMTAEADRRFGQRAIEPAAERPAEERAGHARA
jgi:hypothetical protein